MSLKNRYDNVIIRNNLSLGLSHNALDYVLKLEKENEKLNHYKLLYQKVKERNDKAIEYIEKNCWLSAMKEFNCLESGEVKYIVDILKGNKGSNEVSND